MWLTCNVSKGIGDEGSDVADSTVMTSGLSSAFSCSDINVLFTVMLHMISMTPAEQTVNCSDTEVTPGYHNKSTLKFMGRNGQWIWTEVDHTCQETTEA